MRRRMAVASRPVPEEHDPRVAQARTRVENAPAVAAGGRYASAERMLRAALGVLERRQRYAGAARAAATLGQLLRERGQTARAGAAIQQARLLFDIVETGTPDDPVASLAGGEREDYQAARALLHSPAELPDAGPPPPASRTDAMLEGVAGDLVALVRAVDAASHAEAPPRLCRVLRDRLDAQAVAVYRLRRPPALLAAAGDADRRLPDAVHATVGAGRSAPLAGAARRFHTAVPIHQGESVVGALVMRWTHAPTQADRLVAIARVASTLLEPDFQAHVAETPADAPPGAGPRLLGCSPEMAALHAMIARAAVAPYPSRSSSRERPAPGRNWSRDRCTSRVRAGRIRSARSTAPP